MIPNTVSNETLLSRWQKKEKQAVRLLQVTADLKFNKSIDLVLFRSDIYESAPSQIIHLHDKALNYREEPLDINLTLALAEEIDNISALAPCKIDIGKLGINLKMWYFMVLVESVVWLLDA